MPTRAVIPEDARPRIVSPWRLRNDGEYLLTYKCVSSESRWKVLSPLEASIISFLNGQYTYKELRGVWLYLFGSAKSKRKEVEDALDGVLRGLIHDGIMALEGEVTPSLASGNDLELPPLKASRPPSRLHRPTSVTVALTNKCCADCLYCYAERTPCEELPLAQLCQIFDDLRSNEVFVVDIGGADIFTRRDALLILQEMVARDFVFFLSTKSRIDPETASRLAGLGIGIPSASPHLVRSVQVSVDSADNEMASFLTNCRDYFTVAEKSVKSLMHAGIRPKLKCVLTQFNSAAPQRLVEHFAAMGVDRFQFVQYGRSHYRHNDNLFLSKEQKLALSDSMKSIREQNAELSIEYQDDRTAGEATPNRDGDTWSKRTLCSAGRCSMQVMPNGDCILCDQIPHREEFVVGNIMQQGLMDVWHSPRVSAFIFPPRDHFAGTVCFTCERFDACHEGLGYCFRDSLFHYGTVFDAPPDCPRQTRPPIRQI